MKFWTSEHTFDHPWETVVTASWRKYPNPHNPAVIGLDVVDRSVDQQGVLHSHRLLSTAWGLPGWVTKLIGMDRVCYASEHSQVDPGKRTFTLKTRNITFCNVVTINEVLSYFPDPQDSSKTILHQEAMVSVRGLPLRNKMESLMTDTISRNAGKGRVAMEWVIQALKTEAQDFSSEAKKHIDHVLPHVQSPSTSSNTTL
ncbi:PRELI domain containing protein 3B-like [Babylonia areolata]|uniref:PRELI domain containing protein 3B-like n=1 Tax=Babylonia areolata TaxID=304850 RepID=UPI003FD0EAF2